MDTIPADAELSALLYPTMTPAAPPVEKPPNAAAVDAKAAEAKTLALLYPTMKPAAAPAAESQNLPAPVTPMEASERMADAMYDAPDMNTIRVIENAAMEHGLMAPEEAREVATEWTDTFNKFHLHPDTRRELAEVGASIFRNPPTPETIESWDRESRALLTREYSLTAVNSVLRDAQTLIAREPGLKEFLDSSGLGSHPRVVKAITQRAHALRRDGRL